jgi:hypothetical protein
MRRSITATGGYPPLGVAPAPLPAGASAAAPVAGVCAVVPVAGLWLEAGEPAAEAGAPVADVPPPLVCVPPVEAAGEPAGIVADVVAVVDVVAVEDVVAVLAAPAPTDDCEPAAKVVAPVVPPAVAAVDPAAFGTTGRFAMKPGGSGAWMLESARDSVLRPFAGRNETVDGAGITIPIPAASDMIRWSSASDATLASRASFRT